MTYLEAALSILRETRQTLTTRELTERALARGLIQPRGKTPQATMAARLYVYVRDHPTNDVVKVADEGQTRAQRGSVAWRLRSRSA